MTVGIITARSRKQSRSRFEVQRHIPVIPPLAARLREWLASHPERRLFSAKAETSDFRVNLYRQMDRVTAGTRFQRVRPHMLRHSMRTNLTLAGVDERIIDEILGHTTREMAERYRHITAEKVKAPMLAALEFKAETPPQASKDADGGAKMLDVFRHALWPA